MSKKNNLMIAGGGREEGISVDTLCVDSRKTPGYTLSSNTMKIITYLFLISIIIVGVTGCSQTPIYKSTWQSTPLKIDGLADDWEGSSMYYNSEAKIMYGITNDNKNLFVKLKVTDEITQRKILFWGLTFWMDTLGKNNKQLGITSPVKELQQKQREKNTRPGNNLTKKELDRGAFGKKINNAYASGFAKIKLTGFEGGEEPLILTNLNPNGITVLLHIDDMEILRYEAIIPLTLIFSTPEIYLNDTTKYFSYGFETGHLEASMIGAKSRAGGSPGGGKPGGGGRGGGRMQSPDSERMTQMQKMMEPSKVQVKKAILSTSSL